MSDVFVSGVKSATCVQRGELREDCSIEWRRTDYGQGMTLSIFFNEWKFSRSLA